MALEVWGRPLVLPLVVNQLSQQIALDATMTPESDSFPFGWGPRPTTFGIRPEAGPDLPGRLTSTP